MADQVFMYAIVVGAFAVLAGILFGSREKRRKGREKMKSSNSGVSTSEEKRSAI